MAGNQISNDLCRVLAGAMKVAKAHVAIQRATGKTIIDNSSIIKSIGNLPRTVEQSLPKNPQDLVERASMVGHGVTQFAAVASRNLMEKTALQGQMSNNASSNESRGNPQEDVAFIREEDVEGVYMKSLGVEVMQQQNGDGKRYEIRSDGEDKVLTIDEETFNRSVLSEMTKGNTGILVKPAKAADSVEQARDNEVVMEGLKQQLAKEGSPAVSSQQQQPQQQRLKPLSKKKPETRLSSTSKERKVPSSRIGRLVTYGGLAAGLGFGAMSEITKRTLGLKQNDGSSGSLLDASPFLTEANAERIVDTLCRVRGAALKIGQIMSIQDNTLINPQLQKIFERVRHAADFMPIWQMEQMMEQELGKDWRSKIEEFDEKPFAAASIGQVHLGKLSDGRPVAIKIQYPGVAKGIESDIDNLVSVLNVWNILPKGMYVESVIVVAKRELGWECDYMREAECARKFRELLASSPEFYVPEVIDELTTAQVYTTELIDGIPVDQCASLDQETRDRISYLLLDLFFRELFEFRFMQTDANWANFLYNAETKQIGLLDFGASRDFSKTFADQYMMILRGAADENREMVLEYSRKIGFLTGYESKAMENAHIDTVMLLGEAFRIGDEPYDFGNQNLTSRIQNLVPVMMTERLCPPPEEVYSLHRKLSGMFLLASKLRGKVRCRPIFDRAWKNHSPHLQL